MLFASDETKTVRNIFEMNDKPQTGNDNKK